VIIANPPYSAGQKSENDNAANVVYPHLDQRIRETYAARSNAQLQKGLYNSYIRAIRWGADRLKESGGVMAYVTDAGWLDGNTMDGLRKCLAEDFTSIHIFHLRGNARISGEQRQREKDNVFGQGSRQPVAILVFVRNPASAERGKIHLHDIGDYLTREEKLERIARASSVNNMNAANAWLIITPNEHGDWLKQRDSRFEEFLAIADKEGAEQRDLFVNYSQGVLTARDGWCVSSSKDAMLTNMQVMISVYNGEVARFIASAPNFENAKARETFVDGFVIDDATKISWTGNLKTALGKRQKITFVEDRAAPTAYRPFLRQWLYFDRKLNERVYQIPRIFPVAGYENRVISVSGIGARAGFSALMLDVIPNFHTIDTGQSFPRYIYEAAKLDDENGLFAGQDDDASSYTRRDAITDEGLAHFVAAYPSETITKDDLFHYVYGLLHSEDYRERYADNLTKQLPRIPLMKRQADFWALVEAGHALGDLHVNYESAEPYHVTIKEGDLRLANIPDPVAYFRVEKMKFAGKRGEVDKSTVIYNPRITITGIPLEAYDYVVNGKPALEWVMERQCVKTDAASGIVNDANRYANETVGDPAYPFNLFCRVITVSLETMKIVRALPALDILEPTG
jgi:predicted helicase